MGGGIEAIYDDMNRPTGIARFAPGRPARGAMFAARQGGRSEPSTVEPVFTEAEYYPGFLVHFIVVLAPLTALLAILCAVWPAARRRLVWLVAGTRRRQCCAHSHHHARR